MEFYFSPALSHEGKSLDPKRIELAHDLLAALSSEEAGTEILSQNIVLHEVGIIGYTQASQHPVFFAHPEVWMRDLFIFSRTFYNGRSNVLVSVQKDLGEQPKIIYLSEYLPEGGLCHYPDNPVRQICDAIFQEYIQLGLDTDPHGGKENPLFYLPLSCCG